MKKLCSVILCLMLVILSVVSLGAGANAADKGVLTITANGENPVQVPVGSEIVYYVGLYAGEAKIINCQAYIDYDSDYVSVVHYEPDGDMESYCFQQKINNTSLVLNVDNYNIINYNFTKAKGILAFNDPSMMLVRFRFKAIAPGTTDINHVITYMVNENNQNVYHSSEPNNTINPYTVITMEPAQYRAGDADGDHEVTILDATLIQRANAGTGEDLDVVAADVNGDKLATLKDVVAIRRYLAGTPTGIAGDCVFASEL